MQRLTRCPLELGGVNKQQEIPNREVSSDTFVKRKSLSLNKPYSDPGSHYWESVRSPIIEAAKSTAIATSGQRRGQYP